LSSASIASAAREKQVLLECLLQGPRHSWLHYLDGRQALRVGILLHLGKLRLIRKSLQHV
jgi:hypothetical protein